MAVKIRLLRMGKIRNPQYRIVVADSRTKRDGRVIEEIGKYHPTEEPSFIEVDSAKKSVIKPKAEKKADAPAADAEAAEAPAADAE